MDNTLNHFLGVVRRGRELIIDDYNRELAEKLAAFPWRPLGDPDDQRGFLLMGPVGTGKTHLMRCLSDYVASIRGIGFGVKSTLDIVQEFDVGGWDAIERWVTGPHICFDDLGAEPMGKHYGRESDVMQELLERRYIYFENGQCVTHATTNLNMGMLDKRYGPRFASRLRRMCVLEPLKYDGKDRRDTMPAPRRTPAPEPGNLYDLAASIPQPVLDALKLSLPDKRPDYLKGSGGKAESSADALQRLRDTAASMDDKTIRMLEVELLKAHPNVQTIGLVADHLKVLREERARRSNATLRR